MNSCRGMYARFTEGVDIVVRFEHLNRDFSAALWLASVTRHVELPAVNVTGEWGPSYRTLYSAASRRAVEQTFRADLEQYGYCF